MAFSLGTVIHYIGVPPGRTAPRSPSPATNSGSRPPYKVLAPAFFRAAHRAFASADSFFRAAGLIGLRAGLLDGGTAFFAADLPFRCAHLSFIAVDIRLRAAGLIVRLRGAVLGGRPRLADWGPSPTSAAIAFSMRLASSLSCATMP